MAGRVSCKKMIGKIARSKGRLAVARERERVWQSGPRERRPGRATRGKEASGEQGCLCGKEGVPRRRVGPAGKVVPAAKVPLPGSYACRKGTSAGEATPVAKAAPKVVSAGKVVSVTKAAATVVSAVMTSTGKSLRKRPPGTGPSGFLCPCFARFLLLAVRAASGFTILCITPPCEPIECDIQNEFPVESDLQLQNQGISVAEGRFRFP